MIDPKPVAEVDLAHHGLIALARRCISVHERTPQFSDIQLER